MTYIPSKERAKVIRHSFARAFGNENVSVKKGRGTASSWVEASIEAERPAGCACHFSDTYWNGSKALKPFRDQTGYCEACKTEHKRVSELAHTIEREAMQKAGFEHSTYCADDGYNSENSEYLLQVSIK